MAVDARVSICNSCGTCCASTLNENDYSDICMYIRYDVHTGAYSHGVGCCLAKLARSLCAVPAIVNGIMIRTQTERSPSVMQLLLVRVYCCDWASRYTLQSKFSQEARNTYEQAQEQRKTSSQNRDELNEHVLYMQDMCLCLSLYPSSAHTHYTLSAQVTHCKLVRFLLSPRPPRIAPHGSLFATVCDQQL
jgi:hypothetical protein